MEGILDESGPTTGSGSAGPAPCLPPPPPGPEGEGADGAPPSRFAAQFTRDRPTWEVAVEVWAARQARCSARTATLLGPDGRPARCARLACSTPCIGARRCARSSAASRASRKARTSTSSRAATSRSPCSRAAKATRLPCAPLGARLPRAARPRTPRPAARPEHLTARGAALGRLVALLGRPLFRMKEEQARLIRRPRPRAVVSPNDFGFIDGFIPWDYTRLAGFADVVEADPYVSFPERDRAGRGATTPASAPADVGPHGGRARIIVQGFDYSRYQPVPGDLWTWTPRPSRRARPTSASSPRTTRASPTAASTRRCSTSRAAVRGTRLPAPPTDPRAARPVRHLERGPGPARSGRQRALPHRRDAIYTTYSLLGELGGGALASTPTPAWPPSRPGWRPPGRSGCRAPTRWSALRRAARGLGEGGRDAGGHGPGRLHRTPSGAPLAAVRDALIGAPARLAPAREDPQGRRGRARRRPAGRPAERPDRRARGAAFAAVPPARAWSPASSTARPPRILRPVGAGRVLAFAADPMAPSVLDEPLDLARFVAAIHRWAGGALDHPAWRYRIPGDPQPARLPWEDAVEAARDGLGFRRFPAWSGRGGGTTGRPWWWGCSPSRRRSGSWWAPWPAGAATRRLAAAAPSRPCRTIICRSTPSRPSPPPRPGRRDRRHHHPLRRLLGAGGPLAAREPARPGRSAYDFSRVVW